MYKQIGLWTVAAVCGVLMAYMAYLLLANVSREATLSLYPWQGGDVAGVWVVLAGMAVGVLFLPALRLLGRTVGQIRRERKKAAEAAKARAGLVDVNSVSGDGGET